MVGSTLGSGTELHRARGVTLMARCGASRYRGQICSRRLLGFGATPCRLVSLIHTSVGPYDRARDVRNASDMKVNRMSLALAALGQRAAMASELAGFGRNFRADTNSRVGKNLKSAGGGSLVTYVKNKAGLTGQTFPRRRILGHWPYPAPEELAETEPGTQDHWMFLSFTPLHDTCWPSSRRSRHGACRRGAPVSAMGSA